MPKADLTIAAALATPRPGAMPHETPRVQAVLEGLELSDILYRPVDWFRENPANEIFRPHKGDSYLDDLERDVQEAGILNPLIAMQDGLLIEGESRLIVARRLGLKRLPVREILSDLSPAEQERRLWLGNLSRFEIPTDTRLALYARIWPGYFKGEGGTTRAEVAAATGKSERQVKRDAGIVREAAKIAEAEGAETVAPEHVAKARGEKNEKRKAKEVGRMVDIRTIEKALEEIDYKVIECGYDEAGEMAKGYRESAEIIRKAVGL